MKKPDFSFAVSTSVIIFAFDGTQILFLVGKKGSEPYSGALVLPSAYVHVEESTDEVAGSLVEKIFKLNDYYLEQLHAFTKAYRHPGGRIINVAHFALLNWNEVQGQELPEGYPKFDFSKFHYLINRTEQRNKANIGFAFVAPQQ